MNTFTKAEADLVLKEAKAALEAVAQRHGMTVARVSGSYYDELKLAVTLTKVDLDERGINMASPWVGDYNRYSAGYGLPADGIGRTFRSRGEAYTVLGIERKARTFPVMARHLGNGKTYKFAAETVVRALVAAA